MKVFVYLLTGLNATSSVLILFETNSLDTDSFSRFDVDVSEELCDKYPFLNSKYTRNQFTVENGRSLK